MGYPKNKLSQKVWLKPHPKRAKLYELSSPLGLESKRVGL
jgi:hypothetical protein